jgi:hypothetical protein
MRVVLMVTSWVQPGDLPSTRRVGPPGIGRALAAVSAGYQCR